MLRIAICDDDDIICSALVEFVEQACRSIHVESEIDVYNTAKGITDFLSKGNRYNIFFLDIELEDGTGITVSSCIRNEIKDESAQIIYVSGKTEYDRQLFAFRPFAFIEKPFEESVVYSNIEKYMRIYGDKNDLFHYKYGHDTFWIDLSTVLYFKSDRKIINIISLTDNDHFYDKMSSVIEKLVTKGFISPHKSYLVNYRFIKAFQADKIIMVNGDEIPIAKGKRDEISKMQLHFENGGY